MTASLHLRTVLIGVLVVGLVASITAPATEVAADTTATAGLRPSWVAAENAKPGTSAWRIAPRNVAGDRQLSAYASRAGLRRGGSFTLYVSTTSRRYQVRAYRMGYYQNKGGRLVWQSRWQPGRVQRAPTIAWRTRTVRARWQPSLNISTAGWPEGSYLLKLVTRGGRQRYVPLTVTSSNTTGDLVIMNAVTTWQAYNAWGGYSLYHGRDGTRASRALKVSFDRPYDKTGANLFHYMERGPIMRAERLGVRLAYITNIDLHRNPAVVAKAAGLVSLGHDEYWTRAMKMTVERERDRGMNVAFLGANAVYWRVRLQRSRLGPARTLVAYKEARLDPLYGVDNKNVTVQFRQWPAPSPENSLTGMLYECYPANGAVVIHDPNFFLYEGTGVRKGTSFPGLASIEVDRARRTPTTPRRLQVVAHGPVSCPGGRTYADSTYYTVRGGGGVFSTGTMVWSRTVRSRLDRFNVGRRGVKFARRVTDNLFRAMLEGPLGKTHPSHGNLGSVYD